MQRSGGWIVGRVAGTRVVVRPGAVLLVAAVALLFGPNVQAARPDLGGAAYVVAAGFGVLLLASVFLHELAHALTARRFGLDVPEIAVTLIGGHTQIGGATTPRTEAVVAVVGPVTNGLLAVTAWLALTAIPPGVPALLILLLAYANGFVAVLNLLPGLPLDGGRLLEALVWRVTGRRTVGTTVAAWAGRSLAVGIVAVAVIAPYLAGHLPNLVSVMWAAFVGLILWTGAGPFLQSVRRARAIEALDLARHVRAAHVLAADAVVAGLPEEGEVVVVDQDGPVGYVDRVAADSVPGVERNDVGVLAVLVPLPPEAVVDVTLTGQAALTAATAGARASSVLVAVGADGQVRGLIRVADLVAALRT